jgi:hypothetical protein
MYGCLYSHAFIHTSLTTDIPISIQQRQQQQQQQQQRVASTYYKKYSKHAIPGVYSPIGFHIQRTLPIRTSIHEYGDHVDHVDILNKFRSIQQYVRMMKRLMFNKTKYMMQHVRHTIVTLSFILFISFYTLVSSANLADAAVSGGRMGGGSFKPSSSSSSGGSGRSQSSKSTIVRPSRIYSLPTSPTYTKFRSTPIILNSLSYNSNNRGWYAPSHESALILSQRLSTKDVVVVTGIGMLLIYGYNNNRIRKNGGDNDSLLGSGYTVGSITVSLDVPNRLSTYDNNDNILNKLSQLALSADTMTKHGLQDLLSLVTLELLRQEQYITSACTQSKVYTIRGQAEREFQLLSVTSQSKVDRLNGTLLSIF